MYILGDCVPCFSATARLHGLEFTPIRQMLEIAQLAVLSSDMDFSVTYFCLEWIDSEPTTIAGIISGFVAISLPECAQRL